MAHWPLDDTGASFADTSGRGHTGTFAGLGAPDVSKGYTVAGRTGCYLHIVQSGDACPTVPAHADFDLPDSFTVASWCYWPSSRIVDYGHVGNPFWNYPGILSSGDDFDSGGDWLYYYAEPGVSQEPLGIPFLTAPQGKRSGAVTAGVEVFADQWYRSVWTFDHITGEVRYLLDDVVVRTLAGPVGGFGAAGALLRLGSNPNYGYHEKARVVVADLEVTDTAYVPSVAGWSIGVVG